jgi:purine-nucleoside/S-methyl-5'-thioadenosine phosphorylase / adenosine deaminase
MSASAEDRSSSGGAKDGGQVGTEPLIAGPALEAGQWVWRAGEPGVKVRFVGRGPGGTREEVLARLAGAPRSLAWARQVHSDRVLAAEPGECGEGDALFTSRTGLALAVAAADCVPVLLAGPEGVAAVHAGWRGLAGGVVPRTVERLVEALGARPSSWTAWVGPAIGACCYEVGYDVAAGVAAGSSAETMTFGPSGRPHLDLPAAARMQLLAAGLARVFAPPRCTHCDEEHLWSFRREGKAAGRNLAYIWRTA